MTQMGGWKGAEEKGGVQTVTHTHWNDTQHSAITNAAAAAALPNGNGVVVAIRCVRCASSGVWRRPYPSTYHPSRHSMNDRRVARTCFFLIRWADFIFFSHFKFGAQNSKILDWIKTVSNCRIMIWIYLLLLKVTFFFFTVAVFFCFCFSCWWRGALGGRFFLAAQKKKGGQIIKFIIGSRNSQEPKKKKAFTLCCWDYKQQWFTTPPLRPTGGGALVVPWI